MPYRNNVALVNFVTLQHIAAACTISREHWRVVDLCFALVKSCVIARRLYIDSF